MKLDFTFVENSDGNLVHTLIIQCDCRDEYFATEKILEKNDDSFWWPHPNEYKFWLALDTHAPYDDTCSEVLHVRCTQCDDHWATERDGLSWCRECLAEADALAEKEYGEGRDG